MLLSGPMFVPVTLGKEDPSLQPSLGAARNTTRETETTREENSESNGPSPSQPAVLLYTQSHRLLQG